MAILAAAGQCRRPARALPTVRWPLLKIRLETVEQFDRAQLRGLPEVQNLEFCTSGGRLNAVLVQRTVVEHDVNEPCEVAPVPSWALAPRAWKNEEEMRTQVMIVGAGPVGLTLGCELARSGVQVRIVDKAAQRTDKSKALVLWSRSLELMDRGIGTGQFLENGFNVQAVNFISGEKLVGHVDMSSSTAPIPMR